jgi:CHAT domain-containing protein
MARRNVRPLMVELHRFGAADAMRVLDRYILTAGFDEEAEEVTFRLTAREFKESLTDLRYRDRTTEDAERAIDRLSEEASRIVRNIPVLPHEIVQVDFVAGANELWAFPFEACRHDGMPLFANPHRPVVFTRRVRGRFADQKFVWPAQPSVLFAHAAIDDKDLKPRLIARHREALEDALAPWAGGKKAGEKLLVVKELSSGADLTKALEERRNDPKMPDFTHVHLLAHGKAYEDKAIEETAWGTRLGKGGAPAVKPLALAKLLAPVNGLPVVVTLASCDSANAEDSAMGNYSVAQELHRRGVPVVVGSQLPLTQDGSVLLAKHFYTPLLRGEDVRIALHAARTALYANPATAHHDWLSMVSYVRLPEGYADRLAETVLRTELALLKAVQNEIDALILEPDESRIAGAEARLNERIGSLEQQLQDIPADEIALRQECEGLLASAHKRLAEMYFGCGRPELSRPQLELALEHYRTGFRLDIHNHWLGAQQLALEAVLEGKFAKPEHWAAVMLGAQFDVESNPKEYWALGTIAEMQLLRHLAGHPADPDAVSQALATLRERAGEEQFAIESTRRQFARYAGWWTCDNAFFPNCTDLRRQATEIVQQLG